MEGHAVVMAGADRGGVHAGGLQPPRLPGASAVAPGRVARTFGHSGTRGAVAHSLGSVVTYEALRALSASGCVRGWRRRVSIRCRA